MNAKLCNSKHPIPKKFEASYVFPDTIDRLNNILIEIENIKLIHNKTQLASLISNYNSEEIAFTFTLTNVLNIEQHKKITWEVSSSLTPVKLNYNFTMTWNTLDNSSLLVFELIVYNSECLAKEIYNKAKIECKNACVNVINSIEELLQKNKELIYEYESDIIKAPREKVWNYVTNLEEMGKDLMKIVKFEGDSTIVGNVVSFWLEGDQVAKEFKILEIKKNPNKKKWKYCIMPLGGPFKEQQISMIFVEVTPNESFLSFFHEFSEHITKEELLKLKEKKKMLFSHIRNKLEVSPNNTL